MPGCRREVPGQLYGGGNMSEQEVARLQEQIKTLFSDVDELCGGRLRTHRR